MIAGVGKTFRMLQDAREMLRCGTDVRIGYVEPHGRPDTVRALQGLPVIPRKRVFYKGKEIEEMDLDAILQVHPEIVIVDEFMRRRNHPPRPACRHALGRHFLGSSRRARPQERGAQPHHQGATPYSRQQDRGRPPAQDWTHHTLSQD